MDARPAVVFKRSRPKGLALKPKIYAGTFDMSCIYYIHPSGRGDGGNHGGNSSIVPADTWLTLINCLLKSCSRRIKCSLNQNLRQLLPEKFSVARLPVIFLPVKTNRYFKKMTAPEGQRPCEQENFEGIFD